MGRCLAIAVFLLGLAGCGEAPRTRSVPVTQARGGDSGEQAVTKAPRAIATH
jgi:hypothetical protein